jgi:osmotically-inducible protein OsmY
MSSGKNSVTFSRGYYFYYVDGQVKGMTSGSNQIERMVVEQLKWDDSLDSSGIQVEVKDSHVILKGTVPSLLAKKIAERDVTKLHSVRAVDNHLEVRPRGDLVAVSDEEIRTAISGILACNVDIKAGDIRVFVKNGTVRLAGTVNSFWKKARLEELASSVSGVTDVRESLDVTGSDGAVDSSIERDIVAALRRMEYVTTDKVTVKVSQGVVTLSGSVATWDLAFDIEDTARYTTGVTGLKNQLTIE